MDVLTEQLLRQFMLFINYCPCDMTLNQKTYYNFSLIMQTVQTRPRKT